VYLLFALPREDGMKVQVEDVDRTRRKIEVTLDEEKIRELQDGIYEDLRKRARIKGFRPGKTPRSVLATYYKDFVDEELKRKMAEFTIASALSEAHVDPVSEPVIKFHDEKDSYGYTIECEVMPDFELPAYKGLEIEIEPLKITPEDVDNSLEALKQMHAEIVAKEGEIVIIQYEGFYDGKPLKDVRSESYPLDLGSTTLLPELETAVIGMKVGEEKEVEIEFAADYPDKAVASKKVLFKIVLKEIKEKKFPEINDEFAKDLGLENMERLKESVTAELQKEKERVRRNKISEKIVDQLLGSTDFPAPAQLMEKRLAAMIQDAKTRMKANALPAEEERSIDSLLHKEFEPQAEKGIKAGMLLLRIAEQEQVKVEDSEIEARIKKIAEDTKRGYDYIKDFYEKHNLLGNLKSGMLEEKTMDLLIESAHLKETS
jgi:trigger factor